MGWNTNRKAPHIAAPGTLEVTLREYPDGWVPAVWNDQGHSYRGDTHTYASKRKARKAAARMLAQALREVGGPQREVIHSAIVNPKRFEAAALSPRSDK